MKNADIIPDAPAQGQTVDPRMMIARAIFGAMNRRLGGGNSPHMPKVTMFHPSTPRGMK